MNSNGETATDHHAVPRDIVVGSGARVWRALCTAADFPAARFTALRHHECERHLFPAGSRVWIFAYSRREDDNRRLFETLQQRARDCEFIYISSSGCISTTVSNCYEYPRVKQRAATLAQQLLAARVLVLGLVYARPEELPRGTNVATSLAALRTFMLAPHWSATAGAPQSLFNTVTRPFSGAMERGLYALYGTLLRFCGRWPCLLRPLDLLLRAAGIRWYGYVYLSNRLWTSTT